jgi:AcrR family transcriptional regulator
VTSRQESAAKTRRALLEAAAELLDEGGPEAVTLREVGARCGVSRNAPYRHFADKERLLTTVAVEGWDQLADTLGGVRATCRAASSQLRVALMTFVELARTRPHLYQLMFVIPADDPDAGAAAAGRAQDELLAIVTAVVGREDARRYGAVLVSSAHGIAALEIGRHLTEAKWGVTAEEVVATLVAMTAGHRTVEGAAP